MVPVGDEGQGQTLVNDGTSDIFFRKVDATLTPAGAASVLIATPFFCNRLKAGENTKKAGTILQVVCATGETSTLRIVDGMMDQTGDTDLAALVAVGEDMTSVAVNEDAGGPNELIAAPAAGHQLWIYGIELHANVQGTMQLLSAATAKTGIMPFGAGGGVARDGAYPIFKCGTAEALNLTTVTCAADGIITYRDVTL
jgi:hypothetical protein